MPDLIDELNDIYTTGLSEDFPNIEKGVENIESIIPPEPSISGISPTTIAPPQRPTGIIPKTQIGKPTGVIPTEAVSPSEVIPLGFNLPGRQEVTQPIQQVQKIKSPGSDDDIIDQLNSVSSEFSPVSTVGELSSQIPWMTRSSIKQDQPATEKAPEKPSLITEALRAPVFGVLQMGEIGSGLLAIAGDALKSDSIIEIARDFHKKSKELADPWRPTVQDIREIGGVEDAARFVVSSIGSMLPFMIGTFGAGAAARGLIIKTLGPTIAKKAASKAISEGVVGRIIGKSAEEIAARTGMAAATISSEAGIMAADRLENDMKVLSSDLLWAIPAGMLDVVPQWRLADKMKLFGIRVSDVLKKVGIGAAKDTWYKEFAKQGFLEGITEGWQEILEEMGSGRKAFTKNSLWQAVNAFMAAGITGAFMGTGTNLFVKAEPQTTIKQKPKQPGVLPGVIPVAPEDFTLIPPEQKTGSILETLRQTRMLYNIEPVPGDMKYIWNKVVMGKQNLLPELYGAQFPDQLLFNEREGVQGWQSIWTNIEKEGDRFVYTDFAGGKLEIDYDQKRNIGMEFSPVKYTDPRGKIYDLIDLQAEDALPQTLVDTINLYNQLRSKVEQTGIAPKEILQEQITGMETPTQISTKETYLPGGEPVINILEKKEVVLRPKRYPLGPITFNEGGEPVYPQGMRPVEKRLPMTESEKFIAPVVTSEGKTVGIKPNDVQGGITKEGVKEELPEIKIPKTEEIKGSHPNGSEITKPISIYSEAKEGTGNIWVRQSTDRDNGQRVLLVQISNNLINPPSPTKSLDTQYYDQLYSGARPGYSRPGDFWEIPQWIVVASNSLPNSDVYVVRSIDEAKRFLDESKYGKVAFSVLEANKGFIKDIVSGYNGEVVVGGYVDLAKEFKDVQNVKSYDKIDKFIKSMDYKFNPGSNYRHFRGTASIPRLTLSTGCLFNCSFCDVKPHGKTEMVSPSNIRRQVESIKELNPKLVYLNDKTFGQTSNYEQLASIYGELKSDNPEFEGFVIQTTANQFLKITDEFLRRSGIKYVEIGVESANDDILKAYRKPHDTGSINAAFEKIRRNKLLAVPNIMIGLREENTESYGNTLKFIDANRDIISHINAYNVAAYSGTDFASSIEGSTAGDTNENILNKSWMKDVPMHQAFSDKLFNVGLEQLSRRTDQLKDQPVKTVTRAGGMPPGFIASVVLITPDGVIVRHGSTHAESFLTIPKPLQDSAISQFSGYYDADSEQWFSEDMAKRKKAGEQVGGIPLDELEKSEPEGIRKLINSYERVKKPTEQLGLVYYKGQQRYFKESRNIEKGKNKGRAEVILTDGKKIIVQPNNIVRRYQSRIPELPEWKGIAYRSSTGYEHERGIKVSDVINFEEKELGNKIHVSKKAKELFGDLPASRVVWVTKNIEDAKRYGPSEEILLPPGSTIIGSDDEGGYLVVSGSEDVQSRIVQVKGAEQFPGHGMSVPAVRKVIQDFEIQIPSDVVKFNVLESFEDLPRTDQMRMRGVDHNSSAVYDRVSNQLYIFSNNNKDETDVRRSLFHELTTHVGFERLFGPARMKWIINETLSLYGSEQMKDVYTAYNAIPGTPDGDYTAAIEKIAQISETGENPTLWNKFVTWFRETMEKIFGGFYKMNLSEDDIRVYLWRSRQLIQNEKFQSSVKNYNNLVKLMGTNMFDHGLPLGSLDRYSMRVDTSPSDVSQSDNMSGWSAWLEARKERNSNFGNEVFKDLGVVEGIASLPHWISMKFNEFKKIAEVQWSRQDKRNKDRIFLMKDQNGDNPYITLKNTKSVDKVIIWSDQNDYYIEDENILQNKSQELNGRQLSQDEIQAYHGWRYGFDKAADYAISKLREISLNLYKEMPWFNQLKQVVENNASIESLMIPEEQGKDFMRAVLKTKERYERISEREKQLKTMNFYTPHVRGSGEYVVRVYDKNDKGEQVRVWVERFDNPTSAELGRKKLSNDYMGLDVIKTHEPQTTEFVYGGLDVAAMEAFLQKAFERAEKFGLDEKAADKLMNSVYKSIDEEIMARGFRQHYIHRHRGRVIGGYQEENLHKVFMDYMAGLSGSMTKLEASYDFNKELQKIDKVGQSKLFEYSVRYIHDMLRNSDAMDKKLNALKTIPYAWYLTANLRLAATQFFQNMVTAYPILSRLQSEQNIKGSAATRLAKAMADISSNKLSDIETRMIREAYEEGETMANYIKEIQGRLEGGWAKQYFNKVIEVASIPFAGMERFNRRSSLLAAFRMYTEVGKPYEEAFSLAKEFVRHAHYAYGLSNFPQVLRDGTVFSKMAGMAYVFKSFPHNYVLSMLHFAKDKNGKLALGVMFRSIAMLSILGGLGATPFVDDLLDEYERMTGDPVRSNIRKSLRGVGGDMLSDIGMEGLPALVGIDMSGSLKIQLPIPGVGQFDPSTFTMGVWGGLIDKAKKSLEYTSQGKYARAIEAGAPSGIELIMKAKRVSEEGLRTTGDRPILGPEGKPIIPTSYETLTQLAAFRPHRIAEVQKERRVSANIKEAYAKDREDIRKRLRTATTEDELSGIRRDIQTYNLRIMKYRGFIPRISTASLRESLKPEKGLYEYERRVLQ